MKRWIWAVAACLIGASAANAEYIILRVILNRGPGGTAQPPGMGEGGPGVPGYPGEGPGGPGGPGPGFPGGPGYPG
ncbi:MAG TPA: hypothetical protein VKE40_15875, partial [Gemmataceae bacterium]|nr:hypothetical protein [Gemmataceae bacterium]